LEDPDVDGRIILRWIFRKGNGGNVAETSEVPFTMSCLKYLLTYMLTYSKVQSPP